MSLSPVSFVNMFHPWFIKSQAAGSVSQSGVNFKKTLLFINSWFTELSDKSTNISHDVQCWEDGGLWLHYTRAYTSFSHNVMLPVNANARLTRFLKLLIGLLPSLSDAQQVVLQTVQVIVWAVTLREVYTALAPAVSILAHKLPLGFTADVVECGLNKAALQMDWKEDLQPWGE